MSWVFPCSSSRKTDAVCSPPNSVFVGCSSTAAAGLQLLFPGRAPGYDGAGARLCQFSTGDATGLSSATGVQATSLVADETCRTMVPTPGAGRRLEENEMELALERYRYLLAGHFQMKPPAGRDDPA